MTNTITMKSTGSKTVDQMVGMEFSGNVIPHTWYKTLVKENGKPYLNAIILLSEIVYWYRPVEKFDEDNKNFKGYSKKFRSNLLQMHYSQITEKFGLSKGQARDALVFLEEKNIIKREFRTITADKLKIANVMFIDLNFEELRKITFPVIEELDENENNPDENNQNEFKEIEENTFENQMDISELIGVSKKTTRWSEISDDPSPLSETSKGVVRNFGPPPSENRMTNTKTTTKTTTKITNLSILSDVNDNNDRLDRIENIKNDLYINNEIEEYKKYFEAKLEVNTLKLNHPGETELINNIIDVMAEVCSHEKGSVQVNGYSVQIEIVKNRFMEINFGHLEYILETLRNTTTKIRNIRNYLITTIYNSPSTIDLYYQANVQHNLYSNKTIENENYDLMRSSLARFT